MNLAFIGASGYGNVGDDTYPLIFRQYLSEEHMLTFYNSDAAASRQQLPEYDYVIFGGGGIIYNSEVGKGYQKGYDVSAHFEYMKYYLDFARNAGLPYCFCSADIQVRRNMDDSGWDFRPLAPWLKYLRDADFVSVRSQYSKEVLTEMCRREIDYYPDLAYLFDTDDDSARGNYLLFIPGSTIKAGNDYARKILEEHTGRGVEIKAANFGADGDNRKDLDDFRKLFPNAEVFYGVTPEAAFNLVKRSIGVITGRYHGLVFARATNTPFYAETEKCKYKIAAEDLRAEPSQAIGHIRLLRSRLHVAAAR